MRVPDIIIAPFVVQKITMDASKVSVTKIQFVDRRNKQKQQVYQSEPGDDFVNEVQSLCTNSGVKISELKYSQLMANYPYANGIYIFFTRKEDVVEYKYVGKTTSRAIIDRIGSHLDLRASGLLNCMVKRMASGSNTLKNPCAMNSRMEDQGFLDELFEYWLLFIPVFDSSCQYAAEYKHSVERLENHLIKTIAGPNSKPKYNR